MELPWSAEKAVQQLGRSHRSNQSSAPVYRILTTDLGGEWRFASAIASRLLSMGAITQGDRRAAAGAADMKEFNLETRYASDAMRDMFTNLQQLDESNAQRRTSCALITKDRRRRRRKEEE